jgi:Type I restriction-modification system methyltransferase subunit
VIANPPFNDSDWSGELLRTDGRWKYGVPPVSNATMRGSSTFCITFRPKEPPASLWLKVRFQSKTNGEGEIRKNIIEAGLVDCIVNLPTKLFLNTQIPACLWFLSREKETDPNHPRRNKILFIDARNMGTLINRRTRELTDEDIRKIADTYHNWKKTMAPIRISPVFASPQHLMKYGNWIMC